MAAAETGEVGDLPNFTGARSTIGVTRAFPIYRYQTFADRREGRGAAGRSVVSSQLPDSSMREQAFDHEEAAAILAAMSERVESLDRIQRLRDENERLWQRARELETRRAEVLRPIHEADAVREARRERIRDALRLAACGGVAAIAATFSIFVARTAFGSTAVGIISVGFVAACCLVSARPRRSAASNGEVG